jgi:plasmid stability protein
MTETKHKPPSEPYDKFILRFNVDGMRKQLKVRAAENERTLNAEILHLIKRGLAADQNPQGAQQ